ncbi:MAG: hypothetical protein AB7F75_00090 [Planctomycetota bacterium]
MRVVLTIEARMGSSRLPGKVLKEACGRSFLELMIERVRRAQRVHEVVVATTVNPKDDAIEALCRSIGCSIFRGSEDDVLSRLAGAARAHKADLLVQTTGDCPLHDWRVIDEGVRVYLGSKVDYVSNRLRRSWPTGLDTQVYKPAVLEKVLASHPSAEDREHGSWYIYTHPKEFRLKNYESSRVRCPEKRWCLDYPEDEIFFRRIFESLYPQNPAFTTDDVLAYLNDHPEAGTINAMHPVNIAPFECHENEVVASC